MSGYLNRRERQRKQEALLQCVAGPPRRYFPVAGFVAVVCLATGAMPEAMPGTWKAHELALFAYVRHHFRPGDIFLADRGFSSNFACCS